MRRSCGKSQYFKESGRDDMDNLALPTFADFLHRLDRFFADNALEHDLRCLILDDGLGLIGEFRHQLLLVDLIVIPLDAREGYFKFRRSLWQRLNVVVFHRRRRRRRVIALVPKDERHAIHFSVFSTKEAILVRRVVDAAERTPDNLFAQELC